jgi:hypothetical protein
MLLAAAIGSPLLWQLWSLFPQAIARVVFAILCALACSWWLVRSRRFGLRTLVFVVPLGVAAVCYPARYVIDNQRITRSLKSAGVTNYYLETNGRLAARQARV